jgi:alkylation response protein AidB-like acyl-CoA dehydrogenase
MPEKLWGTESFWGLSYDWDPDWILTDRQKELRETLIGLCEQEMRANAKRSDDELLYPRRNLELLGKHGFLALTVPEEYGGLGENHVAFAMTCETIARYGCASTAMCYVMHIAAVNTIMLRPTPELVDKYIRPLNSGKLGTLSYSDPETGSHFWYPFSSKAERSNGGYKVNKKASWTTSGGFADFYVVQTTSPDFSGYDDLSVFVIDGEDVKAQPSLWDALGLRGNQSGPIQVEDVEVPGDQIVGPEGDGAASNDEAVDPWFLIGSSSVWNGIAMGAIDIAARHTTRKRHVDVGMRVADYPTIQDYVGEAVMDTNACRVFALSVAQAMDKVTDDNTRRLAPGELARADFLHWAWQIKFEAAKNVAHVVDKMLHACGGSGYKRDMELERYVRDAKAGWVMGPTNEVLRQFVGKAVLLGFEALDYWNQSYNRRVVENEVKKLDPAGKRELAEQLMAQAGSDDKAKPAGAVARPERSGDEAPGRGGTETGDAAGQPAAAR